MTTKTLQGFVHAQKDKYGSQPNEWMIEGFDLRVWKHDDMTCCGMVLVAPATITFEVPDSWNPRQAMVEVLRKEQNKVRAEYLERVQQIEDEISKYLAIGN